MNNKKEYYQQELLQRYRNKPYVLLGLNDDYAFIFDTMTGLVGSVLLNVYESLRHNDLILNPPEGKSGLTISKTRLKNMMDGKMTDKPLVYIFNRYTKKGVTLGFLVLITNPLTKEVLLTRWTNEKALESADNYYFLNAKKGAFGGNIAINGIEGNIPSEEGFQDTYEAPKQEAPVEEPKQEEIITESKEPSFQPVGPMEEDYKAFKAKNEKAYRTNMLSYLYTQAASLFTVNRDVNSYNSRFISVKSLAILLDEIVFNEKVTSAKDINAFRNICNHVGLTKEAIKQLKSTKNSLYSLHEYSAIVEGNGSVSNLKSTTELLFVAHYILGLYANMFYLKVKTNPKYVKLLINAGLVDDRLLETINKTGRLTDIRLRKHDRIRREQIRKYMEDERRVYEHLSSALSNTINTSNLELAGVLLDYTLKLKEYLNSEFEDTPHPLAFSDISKAITINGSYHELEKCLNILQEEHPFYENSSDLFAHTRLFNIVQIKQTEHDTRSNRQTIGERTGIKTYNELLDIMHTFGQKALNVYGLTMTPPLEGEEVTSPLYVGSVKLRNSSVAPKIQQFSPTVGQLVLVEKILKEVVFVKKNIQLLMNNSVGVLEENADTSEPFGKKKSRQIKGMKSQVMHVKNKIRIIGIYLLIIGVRNKPLALSVLEEVYAQGAFSVVEYQDYRSNILKINEQYEMVQRGVITHKPIVDMVEELAIYSITGYFGKHPYTLFPSYARFEEVAKALNEANLGDMYVIKLFEKYSGSAMLSLTTTAYEAFELDYPTLGDKSKLKEDTLGVISLI